MNPRCATAVKAAAQAAGKALTKAQVQAIDDGLSAKLREMARRDPAWAQSTPYDVRLAEAGKEMMADIKAAANRKADLAQRQILKTFETDNRLTSLQDSFKDTKHHDGSRTEALKADQVNTGHYITSIRKTAMGGLMDLIEAVGDKSGVGVGRRFLMTVFDADNPVMRRDIVNEIFKNADGHTGNKVATAAARAWLDTIETLRTRFNAAGGDVGKLDYGYTPQPHDAARIKKTGRDAWVKETLPLLDRRKYLRDDGSAMDDAEVSEFLGKAWETLVTRGANKREPGQFGTGKTANRGSQSREIHFADGQAYSAYMEKFGSGTLYDAMQAHIGGMARNIGLVEQYGPDPSSAMRLQFDLASRADGVDVDDLGGAFGIAPQTYWRMLNGEVGTPANERLANTAAAVRNVQTAAKLGGAVISSVTDIGTMVVTAGYNKMPYWQMLKDVASQGSKETRDWMATHGMIAESAADALSKWSGDNMATGWSGKLANSVMRLSLLNAWTDGLRQGFTLSMNSKLAEMSRKTWGQLTEFDQSRLTRAGITEADWAHLNGVKLEQFKGRQLLSPEAIGDDAVSSRIFGFIQDESEYAVVNPDMAARAVSTWGGQRAGTWGGELARTTMQFKSFPIAMMTRHWSRLLEGDHGANGAPMLANRAMYGFALMATTAGLGAIAVQTKQMLQGKDPMDMTGDKAANFWTRATLQGGGMSIAGDLILSPGASFGDEASNFAKNLVGPTIGTVADLGLSKIKGNIIAEMEGKDSHWEAELSRWGVNNTPGASLWWLRPMVDHGFLNAMHENMSPGYLSRMKARTLRETGQLHWWQPDKLEPDRAPALP